MAMLVPPWRRVLRVVTGDDHWIPYQPGRTVHLEALVRNLAALNELAGDLVWEVELPATYVVRCARVLVVTVVAGGRGRRGGRLGRRLRRWLCRCWRCWWFCWWLSCRWLSWRRSCWWFCGWWLGSGRFGCWWFC